MSGRVPRVTILTGEGCPLCDHALEAVETVRERGLSFELEVRKVEDGTPERERIPIVLVDGTERLFGKVGPVLLEREIRAAARR